MALVARGGCVFADKIKAARVSFWFCFFGLEKKNTHTTHTTHPHTTHHTTQASGALAAIIYSNDEPRSPWLATDGPPGANDGDDGGGGVRMIL